MYALHTNFDMVLSTLELNQELFEKVKLVLKDYPEVKKPNPDMLTLRNANQFISLTPNKISFGKNSDLSQVNIDEVISIFRKIINVLEINDKVILSLSSDIISSPKEKSSLKKSLEIQVPNPKDLVAIGLRYFIVNSEIYGDIRIEPYFKDNLKVFYSINLKSVEEVSLDELDFIFKEFWSYTNDIEGLSNELYKS